MFNYNNLIRYKKLQNYWLLFSGGIKVLFKVNFSVIKVVYKDFLFLTVEILVTTIKKLLPLFFMVPKSGGNFLFVGSNSVFSKKICKKKYKIYLTSLAHRSPGIFSNFPMLCYDIFTNWHFKKKMDLFVFYSYFGTNCLLEESKLKKKIVIALVTPSQNSSLIEYPVIVNTIYFHTVFFLLSFF